VESEAKSLILLVAGARYFDWKKTGSRSSCGRFGAPLAAPILRGRSHSRRPVLPLDARQDRRPLGRRPCAGPHADLRPPDQPVQAQFVAEIGKGRMVGHTAHDAGDGGRRRRAFLPGSPRDKKPGTGPGSVSR